jgi:hypothetical protein
VAIASDTTRRLEQLRAILAARRRQLDSDRARLAPDFNALQFLRTDEYGLSAIIRELLDPRGTHGQGASFLELFAKEHLADWKIEPAALGSAEPRLEESTRHIEASRRRIDICLQWQDSIVGIENKLHCAQEQEGQVEAYLEHLGKECSHHRLIYLTRDGSIPSEKSIPASGRVAALAADGPPTLRCIGAADLAKWVDRCAHVCEAERVRAFLHDVSDYIRTELLGEERMEEQRPVVDWSVSNAENFSAAMAVLRSQEAIRNRLFVKLKDHLVTDVARTPLLRAWHVGDCGDSGEPYQVWIRPTSNARYGIRYSLKEGIIGICPQDDRPHDRELEDVARALEARWKGKSSQRWPWFKDFEISGRTGEGLTRVLAKTLDPAGNNLAARVLGEFTRIAMLLDEKGLVLRLQ